MNQSRRRFLQQGFGLVAAGAVAPYSARAAAASPLLRVTVDAGGAPRANVPVQAQWAGKPANIRPELPLIAVAPDGDALPAQWFFDEKQKQDYVLFLIPELAKGQTRTYDVRLGRTASNPPVIRVDRNAENVDVSIGADHKLFTTYRVHSGPNKPSFYPILTPDGGYLVRRWPIEPDAVPGESHDHPHHRGLWFTHSSVNGADFWGESGPKLGRTVNTGFSGLYGGPVAGGFQATTDWHMPDDSIVARDVRTVRFFTLPGGDRLMDFEITLTPNGGPITFGDDKDGVFGLRLPDSLAVAPAVKPAVHGTGHILNSVGDRDGAVWSKPADWVDYWGPIGEKTYGVAIMDHPKNLRHPETWHARDYGLFTVNPFGLHDFGRGPKGAGDYVLPASEKLTFRYRLLFHSGDAAAARVADQYASYDQPPTVAVA